MRLPGTGRERWIAAAFLVVGAGVGAVAFAKGTQRSALIVAPGFIQDEGRTSVRTHRVALEQRICCKVTANVLVFGPGNEGKNVLVTDPTSIDIARPDVAIGLGGQYTILLVVEQEPVASLVLSPNQLMTLDSIKVDYNEFGHTASITTHPEIGAVARLLGSPQT